jgi:hypothetical protein
MLSEYGSVVSVGELTYIADRGFAEDQLCSCGMSFKGCPFWSEVVARVAGSEPATWFQEFSVLRAKNNRLRHIPKAMIASRWTATTQPDVRAYAGMLDKLYGAITEVSGAALIVDSSKMPSHGFVIASSEKVTLYALHLVRDARGVAFSQQKVRIRPEIHWKEATMPRFSPARSAIDWIVVNSATQALAGASSIYMRFRYEDVVTQDDIVEQVLRGIGMSPEEIAKGSGARHELSGNPMRFEPRIKVVPDDAWISEMASRERWETTIIACPLLRHYGYSLIPPAPAPTG